MKWRGLVAVFVLLILASGILPVSQVNSSQTKGEQSVIVILAEFTDLRHRTSRERIYDLVLVQMNNYFQEASYGLTWITGDVTERWYTLPRLFSAYGDLTWSSYGTLNFWKNCQNLMRDAIEAADQEVDFRKYIQVLIVIPEPTIRIVNRGGDRWNIPTNDGVTVNRVTLQTETSSLGIFAHEMGHSLGLSDLYVHDLAAKGDSSAIYVGKWDLMSMSSVQGGFCAYHKISLGWILPNQVNVIKTGQAKTATVDPLEVANQSTYAVKIVVSQFVYYLVEVRQRIGLDSVLPDYGVVIYFVDEVSRGDGFLFVQDGNPSTLTLDDAAFDLKFGKRSSFFDRKNDISIVIIGRSELSYMIFVGPAAQGDAVERSVTLGETEKVLATIRAMDEAKASIEKAPAEGRTESIDKAKSLLANASASFNRGDYDFAITLAHQAKDLASRKTALVTYDIAGLVIIAVAIAVISLKLRRKKRYSQGTLPIA